jgi:hypothetical protein
MRGNPAHAGAGRGAAQSGAPVRSVALAPVVVLEQIYGRRRLAIGVAVDNEVPEAHARPRRPVRVRHQLRDADEHVAPVRQRDERRNALYYVETFNGSTSLATHGSDSTPVACDNVTTNVSDPISLPEVDTATKASNLVVKLYYWIEPLCGAPETPAASSR